MHRSRAFNLQEALPPNESELMQDLELNTLFDAMAQGDPFLFETARKAVLSSLTDPEVIRYRQAILEDGLNHPSIFRSLYNLSVEALENRRKSWYGLSGRSPSSLLYSAIHLLEIAIRELKRMRKIADGHAG